MGEDSVPLTEGVSVSTGALPLAPLAPSVTPFAAGDIVEEDAQVKIAEMSKRMQELINKRLV
jgi:hypothetical protein